MSKRIVVTAVFATAVFGGMSVGWYLATASDPPAREDRIDSITGVNSGSAGSDVQEPSQEGVDQIPPVDEPPPDQPLPTAANDPTANQAVDLKGVQGTQATSTVPENTIQSVNNDEGTFQSIRGIEGIDSVPLQNLEAVLRMQQPPPETEPQGGGARTAAQLLTMESEEATELQPIEDGREDLTEIELEGS